jgi:hypothetical protein
MITDEELYGLMRGNRYPGTLQGVRNFARAIEQAATAPLLERIEELEDKLAEGAQAVRWAPSSAYWSNELRLIFGPEAREGIDTLEARLRKAQDAAEAKLAEQDALLQQERKPLVRADYENHSEYLGCTSAVMRHGFESGVRFAERHHGITEA